MALVDSLDVTVEELNYILAQLNRYIPDTPVWAYGSRVKWTSRPNSDLDLVVFANKNQRLDIGMLHEEFEESNLPFRVNLLIWDEIPASFQVEIKQQYIEIQSNESAVRVIP